AARAAADRADPRAAAERCARRREQRSVWKSDDHDGVAGLGASLPAEIAQAIWQRLTGLARAAKTPGDTRTLDQTRADVYTALLLGRNTGDLARNEGRVVPVEIQVLVPVSTLAGLDDQPGHLVGHGPIPADLARRLAGHAHWRRVLYDPVDGS
nr:DUF222 domain-containing protein [Micromonospora sp. DSM 115978]